MLYGWNNKRFNKEYWGQLERNWNKWKGKGKERTDEEEEEEEIEEGRIEEWDKKDEIEKMRDPYNKL